MQRLPPLPLRETYYDAVRREIQKIFNQTIFAPLVQAIADPLRPVQNSIDPLAEAVRAGMISVERGKFTGTFTRETIKALRALGAKYSASTKEWTLDPVLVPVPIRMAQAGATSAYNGMQERVLFAIDNIDLLAVSMVNPLTHRYDETLGKMDRDFTKSVKGIAIPPTFTAAAREMIAREWATNLSLYIQKWMAEDIIELREKVAANTFGGRRAEDLEKMIMQDYGVSARKAKFLARQETSLLMSKFRETRYRDVGAQKYVWRGAMDSRERPDHKKLEGKVFTWDHPPVVDLGTGRRCNPGEDFGCRCVAVALVE